MTTLQIENVGVRYDRGASAVTAADLEVSSGECAVVLGANGAGKTSLVRAVSGFLSHERVSVTGRLQLDGRSFARTNASARARSGISYIPERDKVFRELTIRENLEIFAQRRQASRGLSEDRELVAELFPALDRLPQHRPAGLLSGGEQQMLALAGAIVSAPKVLLVDEPSLGLAPILVLDVMAALGRIIQEREVALLLVDQNVRSTRHLATKVYTMASGHLRYETGDDIHERLAREGYSRSLA
jgi:branched-chain amino acid transport system ATP-binding protein